MRRFLLLFVLLLLPSLALGATATLTLKSSVADVNVSLQGTSDGDTPLTMCAAEDIFCAAWTSGNGVLNNPPAANEDAFQFSSGAIYLETDTFSPGYNSGPRFDGDAFGGSHYVFSDGNSYVRTGSLGLTGSYYLYIKFRNEKQISTMSRIFIIHSEIAGADFIRASLQSGTLTPGYNSGSGILAGAPFSVVKDAIYHLVVHVNSVENTVTFNIYDSEKTQVYSQTYGISSLLASNYLTLGTYMSGHNDLSIGLAKITSTEPALVP